MQDLLVEWFGTSGATAARYVIAFVVVLVLLLGLRWILRSFSGGSVLRSRNGRQPRLAVMDVTAVDQRRRLVLVRRDNVEHLILIGGPSDIVVEQTIIKGVPVGTMGRIPRAAPADAPAEAPRKAVPQEPPAPTVAAQPAAAKIAASEAAPVLDRPEPSPQIESRRPAPEPARVEPARPAPVRPEQVRPEPSRPSEKDVMPPLAGPPIEVQSPVPPSRPEPQARPQPVRGLATPTIRHGDPQKPYVPPAPSRPTARPEPLATPPIVTHARPSDRAAPPLDDTDSGFDDLALRLDEALRADIAAPSVEPAAPRIEPAVNRPEPTPAPPAAAVRPIRSSVSPPMRGVEPPQPEVRPVETRSAEPARPVAAEPPTPVEPERPAATAAVPPPPPPRPASTAIGGASTWFRPRNPTPATAVTPPPPPMERPRAPEPEPEADDTPTVSLGGPSDQRRDDRVEPVVLGLKPVTETPPVRIPDVEPERLARTGGGAPVLPAVEVAPDLPPPNVPAATVELGPVGERDIGSTLADDLARILVDEESSVRDDRNEPGLDLWVDTPEAAAKPAPVPVVDTTPKAPASDRKDPDFLSLEDEMARLLDELAGDIGKSSKAR